MSSDCLQWEPSPSTSAEGKATHSSGGEPDTGGWVFVSACDGLRGGGASSLTPLWCPTAHSPASFHSYPSAAPPTPREEPRLRVAVAVPRAPEPGSGVGEQGHPVPPPGTASGSRVQMGRGCTGTPGGPQGWGLALGLRGARGPELTYILDLGPQHEQSDQEVSPDSSPAKGSLETLPLVPPALWARLRWPRSASQGRPWGQYRAAAPLRFML